MGIIKNQFNQIGLLNNTQIKLKNQSLFQKVISNIQYNNLLQIESKTLGCNVSTTYNYDKDTQKLINLVTSKDNQNITYTYDPVGNVIQTEDNSQLKYNYNPFYELTNAKGLQHNSVSLNTHKKQYNLKSIFHPLCNMFNINDIKKTEQYNINYNYDNSSNMNARNLTSPSLQIPTSMQIDNKSNRLLNNGIYDKCGNSKILKDKNLNWDFMNNLKFCVNNQFKEYYVYSGRQRIRKVKTDLNDNIIEEKLYIGNYELKIDKKNGRRDGLKIGDFLILHNFQKDNVWLYRYQFTNNVNSVSLELNKSGKMISYDEYYPYGGSSIHFIGDGFNKNEFGWVGQEKDEFSSLIYFGARYYCTAFCRWINPDPGGTVDGPNIWIYVNCNPITYYDVGGYGKRDKLEKLIAEMSEPGKETYSLIHYIVIISFLILIGIISFKLLNYEKPKTKPQKQLTWAKAKKMAQNDPEIRKAKVNYLQAKAELNELMGQVQDAYRLGAHVMSTVKKKGTRVYETMGEMRKKFQIQNKKIFNSKIWGQYIIDEKNNVHHVLADFNVRGMSESFHNITLNSLGNLNDPGLEYLKIPSSLAISISSFDFLEEKIKETKEANMEREKEGPRKAGVEKEEYFEGRRANYLPTEGIFGTMDDYEAGPSDEFDPEIKNKIRQMDRGGLTKLMGKLYSHGWNTTGSSDSGGHIYYKHTDETTFTIFQHAGGERDHEKNLNFDHAKTMAVWLHRNNLEHLA